MHMHQNTQARHHRLGVIALAAVAAMMLVGVAGHGAKAQTPGTQGASSWHGYYQPIPYYNNNPFLFCTLGVPQDCWAPINPQTGAYTVTNPYCFNAASATLYATVCPHAFPHGFSGSPSGNQGAHIPGGMPGGVGGGRSGAGGQTGPQNGARIDCGRISCPRTQIQ